MLLEVRGHDGPVFTAHRRVEAPRLQRSRTVLDGFPVRVHPRLRNAVFAVERPLIDPIHGVDYEDLWISASRGAIL